MSIFGDTLVRSELRRAWRESEAATANAHEEGGFVLQRPDGSLFVERWPRGVQNEIVVPSHPDGKRGDLLILATFHTHPTQDTIFSRNRA